MIGSPRNGVNPCRTPQPLPGTVSDIAAAVIRDAADPDYSNAIGFREVANLMLDTLVERLGTTHSDLPSCGRSQASTATRLSGSDTSTD